MRETSFSSTFGLGELPLVVSFGPLALTAPLADSLHRLADQSLNGGPLATVGERRVGELLIEMKERGERAGK